MEMETGKTFAEQEEQQDRGWLENPEINGWLCLGEAILRQLKLILGGRKIVAQVNLTRLKTGETIDPLTNNPVEGPDNPKLFRSLPLQQMIAFEMFLPEGALPEEGTPEYRETCERSNILVWEFLRFYNDMREIVPFAQKAGGHENTIAEMKKIFSEVENDLKQLLERQNRMDLLETIEQFKREKELVKTKAQKTEEPSEEFAREIKELENAINEYVATKFTLRVQNPLVQEDMHPETYEELLIKYSGYLTKNWTNIAKMTSMERGLAAIHGITMLAQVADDATTPWWDLNRDILNPATQQLKTGKTEEEMRESLQREIMPYYAALLKALKVNPAIIWYMFKNSEFFFTKFLKAYKSGEKHDHDPFWNLRVSLAQEGWFDQRNQGDTLDAA